jgi:hypothetical protein
MCRDHWKIELTVVESLRRSLITISESPKTTRVWILRECAIFRPMYTARVSALLLVFFSQTPGKINYLLSIRVIDDSPRTCHPWITCCNSIKEKQRSVLLSLPLRKFIVVETELPILSFNFLMWGKSEGVDWGSQDVIDPVFFTLFQSACHIISNCFELENFIN